MGSGISALCVSKRSVLIENSVCKLPTIRENDVDSDIDEVGDGDINPSTGKLHAADSRDSGIGENDVPNSYLIQRPNGSGFLRNSSDSSPEKNNNGGDDESRTRSSRPHSCRLGHRGHKGRSGTSKQSVKAPTDITESQIQKLVTSSRNQRNWGETGTLNNSLNRDSVGELSDDTLSLNSVYSISPHDRPKSARKRNGRRHVSGGNSARTEDILDSSTDTEISDTDMLSIPDETGPFGRSKADTQRRGWVRTEDFTDFLITTTSVTPRVGDSSNDMYRIVSATFTDNDVNLAKKASERSISSIILTPMDGLSSPSNSTECSHAPSELCNHYDRVSVTYTLFGTVITYIGRQVDLFHVYGLIYTFCAVISPDKYNSLLYCEGSNSVWILSNI